MIETVYPGTSVQEYISRSRKLPRNVRTCGRGGGEFPVYLEDYVETYIRQLSDASFPDCSVVVLVGQVMETEAGIGLFIRGAINCSAVWREDGVEFGENIWNEVYEKIRLYFPEEEVAGWCIGGPGFRLQKEEGFLRAHIDNFADSEKVLMTYESLEKEEAFRICKNGSFYVLPGYYVYYEKNEEMQNYMLDHKAKPEKKATEAERPFLQTVKNRSRHKVAEGFAEQPQEAEGRSKQLIEKEEPVRPKNKENYRDVLQLGVVAGIIVLIITVLVGVDIISGLQESSTVSGLQDGAAPTGVTQAAENLPTQNPEDLAFGDFSFLDNGSGAAAQPTDGNQTGSGSQTTGEQTGNEQTGNEPAGQDGQPGQTEQQADSGQNNQTNLPGSDTQEVGGNSSNESDIPSQQAQTNQSAPNPQADEQGAQSPTSAIAETDPDPDHIDEPAEEVLAASDYISYSIQPGDTLASICMQFYGETDSLEYISELNQIYNINRIYVGQELILPKK